MSVTIIERIFAIKAVRFIISITFLIRGGGFYLLGNVYKAVVDFCWVYRVPEVNSLKSLSLFFLNKIIQIGQKKAKNVILESFLKNKDTVRIKEKYSLSGKGDLELFRDFIILKESHFNEKGVILVKYTPTFEAFVSFYDVNKVCEKYYIVLEPSWTGYCDPSILMFVSSKFNVIIQCFTESDFLFIKRLNSKMIPIKMGPADWVDKDTFSPIMGGNRDIDLIMVANWGHYKNHVKLFEALGKIKNRKINVLLIGFEWGGRTKVDILKDARFIENSLIHIEIKENLRHQEIVKYLSQSKVLLFLSRKEGDNKAIVEGFFCDVPAIVYKDSIGGAINRINDSTGIVSSFEELDKNIVHMLNNYESFCPRKWALAHTGSLVSTTILNDFMKDIAIKNGESYETDIVEKTNAPNLTYKNPGIGKELSKIPLKFNNVR